MTTYRVEYNDEQGNNTTHEFTWEQREDAVTLFHEIATRNDHIGWTFMGFPEDAGLTALENDRVISQTGYDEEVGNWSVWFVAVNANAPTRTLIVAGKSGPAFDAACVEVPNIGAAAFLPTPADEWRWENVDRGFLFSTIFGVASC